MSPDAAGGDNPAVVTWRLGQVETTQADHGTRIGVLENAVARMWGAVGLACVLIPTLTAFAVAMVTRKP